MTMVNDENWKTNIAVVAGKKSPTISAPRTSRHSRVHAHISSHHPRKSSFIGAPKIDHQPLNEIPSLLTYFLPSCNNDNNKNTDKNGGKSIPSDLITEEDIFCGRGAGAKSNIGNVKFRSLVSEYKQAYLSSKPLEKANIGKKIVSKMINDGGRFLKRAKPRNLDLWYVMDQKAARLKTSQALRERAFNAPKEDDPIYIPKASNKNVCTTFNDDDIVVNDQDVLLGRGGVTNIHVGNMNYRSMVHQLQDEYHSAPKLKKAAIALRVVEQVYNQGGRFLRESEGKWIEVSKERARRKASQTMRERSTCLRLKPPSNNW